MNTIIICDYGWIICGVKTSENTKAITLKDASVVRRWSNGRGIGALAKKEYKGDYMLDAVGTVIIERSKVLFSIPCEW